MHIFISTIARDTFFKHLEIQHPLYYKTEICCPFSVFSNNLEKFWRMLMYLEHMTNNMSY